MRKFLIELITFVVISMAIGKIIENTQNGIAFTELGETRLICGHWKICFYYNLTEYHEEIYNFKITLDEIDDVCHLLTNYNCKIVLRFFKSEYQKMQADVQKLNTNRLISKRSAPLKFMGSFSHWLTGVVDEETAIQYENKINELTMAINERHTIEANKTTLIRKSLVAMQNETSTVRENLVNLHRVFRETMLQTKQIVDRTMLEARMNSAIQMATLIIMEHKDITEKLIRAHPAELIEFEMIRSDLKHIEESLPGDQRLPISVRSRGDVYKILEIAHSKIRVSNKTMLVELSIPLVEDKKYIIFKSTPIPILHNGVMCGIKSEKKVIMANIDNKEYMEISESELNQCIRTEQKEFICLTTTPTIVSDFNACEADILFGDGSEFPNSCQLVKIRNTTYVSEINKPGVYIITPNKNAKIRTICNGTGVKIEVIKTQIELTTEPNCVVRVGRYRLRQSGIFVTNHTNIGNVEINLRNLEYKEIAPLNITSKISEIAFIDSSNDFSKLIQEAEVLEHRENSIKNIEKLQTDYSLHSYSLLGLSTTTVIILAFLGYIIFCKLCPLATSIAQIVNPHN